MIKLARYVDDSEVPREGPLFQSEQPGVLDLIKGPVSIDLG